ncbi:unnamed protein product [Cyprideis torosa]|uniref:Exocyst complex component 6 n=1 Tax=Cyprideis torosa TaxID=163714 RepID=A0A7R8ZM87_9CRUS|nr:unnamed protein product [Cyprideis torosa]CAG0888300.1 unnamed protein product [Cyprideis torosa]
MARDFKPPRAGAHPPDSPSTGTTGRKRKKTSAAASSGNSNHASDLAPPPLSGYGETIVASNPFDDAPSTSPAGRGVSPMLSPAPPMGIRPPSSMDPMGMPPVSDMGWCPPHPGMMPPPPPPVPPMPMGPMGPGGGNGPIGSNGPIGPMVPSPNGPMGPGPNGPMGSSGPNGKVYPPNQPMVFNPQNPNAPPIYPCGICHKEVHDNDQAMFCESRRCFIMPPNDGVGGGERGYHGRNVDVGEGFPYGSHISSIEALEDHLVPTFKTVYEAGEQQNFLKHLGERIESQNKEIKKMCNAQYEGFVHSTNELIRLRSKVTSLQQHVQEVNSALKVSADEVLESAEQLSKARLLERNSSLAIDYLRSCLPVLQMFSKCESAVKEGKLATALKILAELEVKHLPKMPNYNFIQELRKRIPMMRAEIKSTALNELKEFLEIVRRGEPSIGRVAMKHAAEEQSEEVRKWWLELFGSSARDENEEELSAGEMVDFSPVYKCFHIYSLVDCKEELLSYYRNQRQQQALLAFQPPTNMHGNVRSFVNYFFRIIGFFVVDIQLMNTTPGLVTKAQIQNVWKEAAPRIISSISTFYSFSTDTSSMIQIKNLVLIFTAALDSYEIPLEEMGDLVMEFHVHYTELLMQRWVKTFRDILDQDTYQSMVLKNEEDLERLKENFPYDTSTITEFPATLEFSETVVRIFVAVKRFIIEIIKCVSGLGLSSHEVHDRVRKSTNLLLTRTLSGCLCSMLRKPNVGLTQLVQIFHTMSYLEDTSVCLEDYISQMTGQTGDPGTLHKRTMFKEARSEAEQQIYIQLRHKIDEFLSLSSYDWTIDEAEGHASGYMLDLIAFLGNTLDSFTNLPKNVTRSAILHACQHLGDKLLSMFLDKDIKVMTHGAVMQFNIDLMQCEQYACSIRIDDVDPQSLMHCFTELRQILDLLTSWDWSTYFHDFGKDDGKYSRVSPQVALQLLERLKGAEGKSVLVALKRSDRDRKKLWDTVHKQLRQLCAATTAKSLV